jgi:glycine/D-amino acid oxidase-like deaminating enzyme/nitrite reductase/ring-hydroxylating ferredoxin subunit
MSGRNATRAQLARHESVWSATADVPTYPPLAADATADVCVVGAGIAGLTTAYLLTQAGKSVVVLDDGPLAGGQTQATTAHLVSAIDDRFVEIERLHGAVGAGLAARSHAAAINRIEAIVRQERIACEFERVDGYLFLPPGGHQELLQRELAAARRAGLTVERVRRAPVASFDTGPCLRFADQGQFHPLKYLAGLARAIERDGGRIHGGTHADQIAGGAPALVTAGPHTVMAHAVVVATNAPVNDLGGIHPRQIAHLTYAIGVTIPRGAITPALYWDTDDPYHYLRLERGDAAGTNGTELLIVGGEDHRTGHAHDTTERHGRLERWARERFPMIEQVEFAWSGQVMETLDGLALIGRNPDDEENVYVITGDSGMGMTHGTVGGMVLTDLICGRDHPWAAIYDPARARVAPLPRFAPRKDDKEADDGESATAAGPQAPADLAPDSGAVFAQGHTPVAAYRDEHGTLHELSARCTHLGCTVTWNASARTWDCPCHGSRFDRLGTVVNGPANRNLEPVE